MILGQACGVEAVSARRWTALQTREVLPQRGHGLRPSSGRAATEVADKWCVTGGSMNGIMAPIPDAKKRLICREELPGVHDSRPLGTAMRSSGCYALTLAQAFAERGVAPDEISLRLAVLGAEPWTDEMRREVDAGLGVASSNIYGLSEVIGPGVSSECIETRSGCT